MYKMRLGVCERVKWWDLSLHSTKIAHLLYNGWGMVNRHSSSKNPWCSANHLLSTQGLLPQGWASGDWFALAAQFCEASGVHWRSLRNNCATAVSSSNKRVWSGACWIALVCMFRRTSPNPEEMDQVTHIRQENAQQWFNGRDQRNGLT